MSRFTYGRKFLGAVAELSAAESKQVLDCVVAFQANPANPGHSLERLASGFWSIRASQELRVILHKDGDTWFFLHADHHDVAYLWASRRQAGRNPITNAIDVVETVETIREVEKVIIKPVLPEAPPLLEAHEDDYLLSLGLPANWLPTVRKVRSEGELLGILPRLDEDISERLLRVAMGELVTPPTPATSTATADSTPDSRRRFFVPDDEAELRAALQAPRELWLAFLHPDQRAMVHHTFSGPAKVSGSAGTGKTVVALHRARRLARQGRRVLLTTYVSTLCDNLNASLALLCTRAERDLITVSTVHSQALRLVRQAHSGTTPDSDGQGVSLLRTLHPRLAPDHDLRFALAEWTHVIAAQGIRSWPEYRRARRTGRGSALQTRERHALWALFGEVQARLAEDRVLSWAGLCREAEALLDADRVTSPYDAVLVDEVQDLKPPALRFLRALTAKNPGELMLFGDAGQRIFPGGFSLSRLGIEVRGRATVLRVNYRTTEQIRGFADRLIDAQQDDLDGNSEARDRTRSLVGGPTPTTSRHRTWDDELQALAERVKGWSASGIALSSMAVFARTERQLDDVADTLDAAGTPFERLSPKQAARTDAVRIGNLHRAKGLEFKAVAVAGCTEKHLPHPAALANLDDPKDREEALERERSLLYVGCTRARHELHVSWHGAPSPFLAPALETP